MAKAIFHKDVGYTPIHGRVGFYAKAGKEPQSFPESFIAYAVEAGAATRVDGKGEATKADPEKK